MSDVKTTVTIGDVYKKYEELLAVHGELEDIVVGVVEEHEEYYKINRPDLDLHMLGSDFFEKHKRGKRINIEKSLLDGEYDIEKLYKIFVKRESMLKMYSGYVEKLKKDRNYYIGLLINILREFYNDIWIDVCRVKIRTEVGEESKQ